MLEESLVMLQSRDGGGGQKTCDNSMVRGMEEERDLGDGLTLVEKNLRHS